MLSGILPDQHWDHYCLLVIAVSRLPRESISENEIAYCHHLLNTFCSQFSSLYGERYMSMNVHLLLLLSDTVRELAYTCVSILKGRMAY